MDNLLTGLIHALLEVVFAATGRRLLGLFGWRRPYDIVSIFSGLAFWAIVGVFAYAVLR
jgi:hypothetical protein